MSEVKNGANVATDANREPNVGQVFFGHGKFVFNDVGNARVKLAGLECCFILLGKGGGRAHFAMRGSFCFNREMVAIDLNF